MADGLGEVTTRSLQAGWDRWIGPQRFKRKLSQFTRSGWAEVAGGSPNTERIIRLTQAGRNAALGGRTPDERWRRAWDGRWRIVLFDVPENQSAVRNRLRRKLRNLNFGYLQNSAWITPDGIDTLRDSISGSEIDVESLSLMEARPCGGEKDADIVAGAWDFRRIDRNYDVFCDLLDAAPTRLRTARTRRSWFDAASRAWSHAIQNDPLLPEALLPPSYRGREAWHRHNEVFRHRL